MEILLQFTAVQAVKKETADYRGTGFWFTAVQAVKKFTRLRAVRRIGFTTVQAAKKCSIRLPSSAPRVPLSCRCDQERSENGQNYVLKEKRLQYTEAAARGQIKRLKRFKRRGNFDWRVRSYLVHHLVAASPVREVIFIDSEGLFLRYEP